ncbi:MAG TPA: hypothetical protein VMS12_06295 [Thermoanaerobaculia bacterium]|nr:hypothetical protein [Thermoanaerobaculia bacterium]
MRVTRRNDPVTKKIARLDQAIYEGKLRCQARGRDLECRLELDRIAEQRELLEDEPSLRPFRRSL